MIIPMLGPYVPQRVKTKEITACLLFYRNSTQ